MEYAQSRLQARFGKLADEPAWERVETAPDIAAALEGARSCALATWTAGIGLRDGRHDVEVALRGRWREGVDEVAAWMPPRWQPAVLWTRELVDLPALAYLGRGGAPLPWMQRDPVLQRYAQVDARTREGLLREYFDRFMRSPDAASDREALASMLDRLHVGQAWLAEWRRRWPRWTDTERLDAFVRLIEAALQQPAPDARPVLVRELRRLFRRSVLDPVVAFVYIAFTALQMWRLRAALLKHSMAQEGLGPT